MDVAGATSVKKRDHMPCLSPCGSAAHSPWARRRRDQRDGRPEYVSHVDIALLMRVRRSRRTHVDLRIAKAARARPSRFDCALKAKSHTAPMPMNAVTSVQDSDEPARRTDGTTSQYV